MSTMNISLPEQLRSFVEARVRQGQYSSASDYVRALIREDQERRAQAELESKLLNAIESGQFSEITPELFDRLHERANRVAAKERGAG
jgi:antitoxin ParD1/3/4